MFTSLINRWKSKTPDWARVIQFASAIVTGIVSSYDGKDMPVPKWLMITAAVLPIIAAQFAIKKESDVTKSDTAN